jgi:hypothetical protein
MREGQHGNGEYFLQPHCQESEKWQNIIFGCFIIFVRKGVGLLISVVFFLEEKSLQENNCFKKSSVVQSQTSYITSDNLKSSHGTRVK